MESTSVTLPKVVAKPSGGQVTILVAISAAVGVVYVARLAGSPTDALNQPGQMLRIALGGSVVLVVLLVMADASPNLAKAFAWMILLGTVVGYGSSAGEIAAKVISGALKLSAPKPAGTIGTIAAGPALRTANSNSPFSGSPRIAPRSAWEILTGQP